VDNIRMDLGDVGWGDVAWIGPSLDRDMWKALVNMEINLRVLQNAGELTSGCTLGGLSSSAQFQ
jgi:hypothetical protein